MDIFMEGSIVFIIESWDFIYLIKPKVQLYFHSGSKYKAKISFWSLHFEVTVNLVIVIFNLKQIYSLLLTHE